MEILQTRRKFQLLLQDPYGCIPNHKSIYNIVSEPLIIHGEKNKNIINHSKYNKIYLFIHNTPYLQFCDFTFGGKRCHGVYDYYIDRPRTDEVIGDLQCLFPVIGLGDY